MQLREINALMERTDAFAISPTMVDRELPWGHSSRQRSGCPTGLAKAVVLETNAHWIEQTSFACSTKTHPVERSSGVLVRVKRDEMEADGIDVEKLLKRKSDYAVEVLDDPNTIQMIISRKAVIMPWSDYKPTRDFRRKQQRDADRRSERMSKVVDALGAESGHWGSKYDKGVTIYPINKAEVKISLKRAEELVALLEMHGLLQAEVVE